MNRAVVRLVVGVATRSSITSRGLVYGRSLAVLSNDRFSSSSPMQGHALRFFSSSPEGPDHASNGGHLNELPSSLPIDHSAAIPSPEISALPTPTASLPDHAVLTEEATLAANEVAGVASSSPDAAVQVAVSVSSTWSDVLLHPATSFLNYAHDFSGLPWWATIVAATIGARALLLPVSLYTMRNAARMAAIQDDLKVMREDVMASMRAGNRQAAGQQQQDQRDFLRAAGVSPGKLLLGPLVQFPVFISFFVAIRRLSQSDPAFATGGAAWFLDLAASDPIFVLPVMAGLTLGLMTELGGDTGTKMTGQMKNVIRGMAVLSVPMTAWFPSAIFCYWIPNNLFSVCLSSASRVPAMRQVMGLNPDLSAIPGTRAAIQARKAMIAQPPPVSAEVAAVSYMRKSRSSPDGRTQKERKVPEKTQTGSHRPILFKNRKEAKSAEEKAKM
jgi:YidC/Oxa1 family membrane protein insertase